MQSSLGGVSWGVVKVLFCLRLRFLVVAGRTAGEKLGGQSCLKPVSFARLAAVGQTW